MTPSRDWKDSKSYLLSSTHARMTLLDSFFVIAFASYVESQTDFKQTFYEWLQVCPSNFEATRCDR